jgi:hypothetical protein
MRSFAPLRMIFAGSRVGEEQYAVPLRLYGEEMAEGWKVPLRISNSTNTAMTATPM